MEYPLDLTFFMGAQQATPEGQSHKIKCARRVTQCSYTQNASSVPRPEHADIAVETTFPKDLGLLSAGVNGVSAFVPRCICS